MLFPIEAGKTYSKRWQMPGTKGGFGADRSQGRTHAGCDLGAAHGVKVHAIEGGKVVERSTKPFIEGSVLFAIAIKHDSGFVARYTEINGIPAKLTIGSSVGDGEELGHVQLWGRISMCHTR